MRIGDSRGGPCFTLTQSKLACDLAFVRKGTKSSAASAVVQAPAGTRSFVLRSKALKKGTYTVSLALAVRALPA